MPRRAEAKGSISRRLYYRDRCLPARSCSAAQFGCFCARDSSKWLPGAWRALTCSPALLLGSLLASLFSMSRSFPPECPTCPPGHLGRSIQTGQSAVTCCKGGQNDKLTSAVILRQHTPGYPNASSSSTLPSLPATVRHLTTPLHTGQGSVQGSAHLQAPPPSAECPRTSAETLTKGRG